jgi:FKBP-type peptidyl-prolyl cis-trans isomerase
MKNFILYFFSVLLIFTSCKDNPDIMLEREKRLLDQYFEQNNISVEPHSSGIYYLETVAGSGLTPVKGDYVIVQYTARLIDDKIFDTTDEALAIQKGIYSTGVLYGNSKFKLEKLSVRGIEEGLKLMKEGGEARLIIPSTLGYGTEVVNNVPAYSTLVYDIKLLKVIKDPDAYELLELQVYLDLYNDSLDLTVSTKTHMLNDKPYNWYYIELTEGEGDFIEEEYTVYIYYEGKLVDGRVFDKNFGQSSTFNFKVGSGSVIKGMDLAVLQMKKNGKSRAVVPSALGYGEAGSGKIPPFSPLVFDILVTKFDTIATPQ